MAGNIDTFARLQLLGQPSCREIDRLQQRAATGFQPQPQVTAVTDGADALDLQLAQAEHRLRAARAAGLKLCKALPNANLVDATDLMLTMRSIKDPCEFETIRKAVAIMEEAAIASMQVAKAGNTDRDIAAEFKKVAMSKGCWVAGHNSQVIVSAGPDAGAAHLAGPHPVSVLKDGDILRFDYGVNYDGYLTDFARAYVIGDGEPNERLKKLHETILRANRTMVASIKPGLRFCDLFEIGMNVVKEVYPTYARGHLGHSISFGPNNEEAPFISAKETREIQEGMVLCIEVPFYIIGFGGINIEDMVIVTKDGTEALTKMSRDIHLPLIK